MLIQIFQFRLEQRIEEQIYSVFLYYNFLFYLVKEISDWNSYKGGNVFDSSDMLNIIIVNIIKAFL